MSEHAAGPGATHVLADAWWERAPRVPGSRVALFLDSSIAGADMYSGVNVLAPGATIPLHWHPVGELQFILYGSGILLGPGERQTPLLPHSMVFCPAGLDGAHGFTNTGGGPLGILFCYPSAGGQAPELTFLEGP